jgi:hypothetical protein
MQRFSARAATLSRAVARQRDPTRQKTVLAPFRRYLSSSEKAKTASATEGGDDDGEVAKKGMKAFAFIIGAPVALWAFSNTFESDQPRFVEIDGLAGRAEEGV